jgi:putative ABC transport system permease protein
MFSIALKILWADAGKAAAMIIGVAFSTLLMAQQAAIFVCLMANSASHIAAAQDVDIWVADMRADYFDDPGALPPGLVNHVRSVPGVAAAAPYLRTSVVLDSSSMVEQGVLIGLDPYSLMGAPKKLVSGSFKALRTTDAFVVDRRGYNDIWPGEDIQLGRMLEIDGRRLHLVGVADPPSPFISMPLIYTSTTTAQLIRPGVAPGFILARATNVKNAQKIAEDISDQTGYGAFRKDAFSQITIDYYLENTGIPINFMITITLGFIVGATIVAQTFYLFVTENLRYLAVFKAMGAKAGQLVTMTAAQCLVIAAVGFSLGIAGASWFFETVPEKVTAFKGFYLPADVFLKTAIAVLPFQSAPGSSAYNARVAMLPHMFFRTERYGTCN